MCCFSELATKSNRFLNRNVPAFVIRFTMKLAGQSRSMTATVTEPSPGRVLVESGPGVETTFTVEPEGGSESPTTDPIALFDFQKAT